LRGEILIRHVISTAGRSFDDGSKYLVADLSIECDGATYQANVAFASLMVFIYPLGVPALFLWLLASKRHLINPPGAESEYAAYSTRAANESLDPIRILFDA
jgi:hypothetical protein